jgi:hypothetical protein
MVSSATSDRHEGEQNLLLVFAPAEDDDRFDGQLLCINDYKEGFLERDVTIYLVVGEGESTAAGEPLSEVEAESLRKRYGAGEGQFLVVLVGMDGKEKARSTEAVPPGDLFRAIDTLSSGSDRADAQTGSE